jgi:hypothetical protein
MLSLWRREVNEEVERAHSTSRWATLGCVRAPVVIAWVSIRRRSEASSVRLFLERESVGCVAPGAVVPTSL